jgi:sulfoxide reductase catalytic subunit YedY
MTHDRSPFSLPNYEITPPEIYAQRRQFLQLTAATALAGVLPVSAQAGSLNSVKSAYQLDEALTPLQDVTHYNNFYEFSTSKEEPAHLAHTLMTHPWTLTITGEVNQSKTFDIDTLLKLAPLEERVYRLRCVEGWSMVIPWLGYSLATLLKQVEPTSKARYVEFVSLHDPQQMPGQRSSVLQWPYVEGLRLDEALHPLTLLTFGLYGEVLPQQNGAPVRLIVPWKYGFKSAKSLVAIRLVEQMPQTAWMKAAPSEYGFYANVNPAVDHPRWSQAKERRIGEFFKRATLPFNGYADAVASLYTGMDLVHNF